MTVNISTKSQLTSEVIPFVRNPMCLVTCPVVSLYCRKSATAIKKKHNCLCRCKYYDFLFIMSQKIFKTNAASYTTFIPGNSWNFSKLSLPNFPSLKEPKNNTKLCTFQGD